MTALPAELPDAMVPEAPFLLPAPHLADATPPAQHASDASDAVLPDEVGDATDLARVAAPYAEKLVVRERVVPGPVVTRLLQALPAAATVPCTPDAGRSAA